MGLTWVCQRLRCRGGGLCLQAGWGWGLVQVHCYALPSSTLTAWGLMAPVRAGLACPVEGRGSWSLLVIPPEGVFPSPTDLRTSRMVLLCTIKKKKVTRTSGSGPKPNYPLFWLIDWFISCTIWIHISNTLVFVFLLGINYGIIPTDFQNSCN